MSTIKDIALAAQVSPATVSRILNQDSTLNVTPQTRQKVLDTAREMNYVKKKRSTRPSFSLGIVQWFSAQEEINDTYYLMIRQGIEDYCNSSGIHVIRTYKADFGYEEFLKDVDGLICIGKFCPEEIAKLKKITSRILFLDMPVEDPDITTITLDFHQAVTQVLSYLRHKGYRKIGFLSGREYLDDHRIFPDERPGIFIDFCRRHGIEYESFLLEESFTSDSGYHMMSSLIASGNLPEAVFAASDLIAIGALKALNDHGYQVPKDIGLVGFDDLSIAEFTAPPLTTVHAPAYEMGYYGAQILHQFNHFQTGCAMKIKLPCRLVERKSC
ncbi:MAG: LacI family DNA-binding transcriptional regulator [Ruminococcus sp.]|jgi:LacI family transcriptional regulator